MIRLNHLLTLIILICALSSNAQNEDQSLQDYFPEIDSLNDISEHRDFLEYKLDLIKDTLSTQCKRDHLDFWKGQVAWLDHNLETKDYTWKEQYISIIEEIADEIFLNNPDLDRSQINFKVSRDHTPNAYSTGEGTLVFNLGLISYLENVDQLAVVVGHEMAHFYLNHMPNRLNHQCAFEHDKEFKKKVRMLSKMDYEGRESIREMLESKEMFNRRHSRYKETEADSLGYEYIRNTKYDSNEAIRLVEILDLVDAPRYTPKLDYKLFYNFEDYPFKDDWLASSSLISFKEELSQEKKDSLSTHPNTDDRIEALLVNFPQLKRNETKVTTDFFRLRYTADLDKIEYTFYRKDYDYTLFYSMKFLQEHLNNKYAHAMIARVWTELYNEQKNHNLGKYFAFPNEYQNAEFRKLLTFVRNLRLSEMKKIAYHYLLHNTMKYGYEQEDLLYARYEYLKTTEDSKHSELKNLYLSLYPKGKYINYFKN